MEAQRSTLSLLSSSDVNKRSSVGGKALRKSLGGAQRKSIAGSSGRKSLGHANVKSSGYGRQSVSSRASLSSDRASLSSRKSGGRQSLGRQSLSRQSLAGRRSSVHAHQASMGDPRPITDKSYIKKSIRKLIAFLSGSGYHHPISPKLLMAPTHRDFQAIFTFIYQKIDSHYSFDKVKFEDEIPLLFSKLGYPFAVKKSYIFACGSSHNWPKLLAALTWLCELATYLHSIDPVACAFGNAAGDDFEQQDDEAASESEIFYEYLVNSYSSFMMDDGQEAQLDEDLAQTFEERNKAISKEMAELTEKNEQIELEIADLEQMPTLDILKQQRATFTQDRAKFTQYIDKMTVHCSSRKQRLDQVEEELAKKVNQLEKLRAEKQDLQSIIATQKFTQHDIERINLNRNKIQQELRERTQEREDMEAKAWDVELALSKETEVIEKGILEYNRTAESLGIIPNDAPNAKGLDVAIHIDPTSVSEAQMLSVELKASIKPGLMSLKDMVHVSVIQLQEQSIALQEELDKALESASQQQDELAVLHHHLSSAEERCQDEARIKSETYRDQASDLHNLLDDTTKTKHTIEEELAISERTLEQTNIELEGMKSSHKQEREAMVAMVHQVMQVAIEHKQNIQDLLTETKEQMAIAV